MAKVESANARIFGDDNDYVAVADLGAGEALLAALPTTIPDQAPAPFEDFGWLGEDGISLVPEDSIEKFKAHQGGRTVRTKVTSSDTSFKFTALESTALAMGLALDFKETNVQGNLTVNKAGAREVIVKSFVFTGIDDNHRWMFIIDRGEIGERNEVKLVNSEIVAWEFTVTIIGDYYVVTEEIGATPAPPTPPTPPTPPAPSPAPPVPGADEGTRSLSATKVTVK